MASASGTDQGGSLRYLQYQRFESVGSMVVYERGKPKRSDYRKFKIQTVQGPDDYASMEEVLTRRFSHGLDEQAEIKEAALEKEFGKFSIFPDLIMMDGGRGQVNMALEVLEKIGNVHSCMRYGKGRSSSHKRLVL